MTFAASTASASSFDVAKRAFGDSSKLSQHKLGSESSDDSRLIVKKLFKSVVKPNLSEKPETFEDDVVAIAKAAKLIVSATEDGTLTPIEADAVLTALAEGFTQRRFDKILERISDINEDYGWFVAASRSSHEYR